MKKIFYDKLSEKLYGEIPDTLVATDKVMLSIQGGTPGIELQETLFNLKGRRPRFAYIMTTVNETERVFVRKLPVVGIKDWLLIYEDNLFLLAVKDAYDEIDIRIIE